MSNNRIFRLGAVAVVSTLAAATLVAQQKPAPAGDPVTISFRALTSAGSPVTDLTAADIALKVGGRDRVIRSFERLRLGEDTAERTIPLPFATNVVPASGPRDTIVMIDDESIPPGEEKRVVAAMDQYLAALGPGDRVGIVTVQDRGLNVGLTTDRDKVRAGLKATAGRAPSAETADNAACRTRRVMDAITSIAGNIPPGSAPVSVLTFTTGVSVPAVSTTMARLRTANDSTSLCDVQARDFQQIERATLSSAINLHVVAAALSSSTPMQQGLENLAGASGNPLVELAKSGDSELVRVARESTAWYRVSFVADANERNDDVQRVEVQSKRAGVETRSRSQVLIAKAPASTQPASPKDMLREATVHRDFEFRAAAYTSQEPGSDKVKVVILLEPVDTTLTVKSASVGLFDPKGKLSVQGTGEAANLARSPGTMAVLASPGMYRLRVAAVDNLGHGGTVDTDIDVSLTKAAALQMGSLILGVADGGSFAGRLKFSSEPAAIGYLEVYGAPAAAQLTGQLEIAATPTGPALATAATKVLDGGEGRKVILGGVSILELPASDVLLRMVVSLDGKPVGQVIRTLRKVAR